MNENQDDDASVEKLIEDLKMLVSDSEALLTTTAAYADEQVQAARSKAEASIRAARERIGELREEVGNRGQAYLRDNPWVTAGIAAALGFLLGAVLTRRPADD